MQASQNLIIKNILMEVVKRRATDLHFSVSNYPILRVGGELIFLDDQEVVTQEFMDIFTDSLFTEEQKKKLVTNKEIILTYDFDRNLRFKINIFYQRGFLSATLRHIPTQVPTISSLGLSPIMKEIAQFKKGLVIVSGPFSSGRSTTAAAVLEEINQTRKVYAITIEEPIEYVFTNSKSIIEQREVGRDTRSFTDALAYFEEEDGDVLFFEEMRNSLIIPNILEIARGGALVLSTMSADSTAKTIARILDSFQSFDHERVRDLLSSSLKAIVCQKLVPKIGGGLMAVQEIMIVNEAIKSIIAKGDPSQIDNIIQISRKEGMITFDQALAGLVRDRKISLEDALDNSSDRKTLENLLKNE